MVEKMHLKYKPDFSRVQKYMDAYWEMEIIDRPILCVTASNGKERRPSLLPWVYLQNLNTEDNYRKQMEDFEEIADTTYYGGEAVPTFSATFGPDQYAAFMGAEIHFAQDSGT